MIYYSRKKTKIGIIGLGYVGGAVKNWFEKQRNHYDLFFYDKDKKIGSEFKSQSPQCHIQVFRQILTPIGIFHCPAYRGFKKAKIGETAAFLTEKAFQKTISENYKNLIEFNPPKQCRDIVCFYNPVNRWIEDFIKSGKEVKEIEVCPDDNFFI